MAALKVRGELLVVAAALLFSTGGAAIKGCTLGSGQIAGLRSGIAAVMILVVFRGARRCWDSRTFAVALAYAATLILYVSANKLTTSAHTIFLQSTAPLYILVLGPWLLRESLVRSDLVVVLLVVTGLVLLLVAVPDSQHSAPRPVAGNLLAAVSGITWALAIIGLRWLGRDSPRLAATASQAGCANHNPGLSAVAMGNLVALFACAPWLLHMPRLKTTDVMILVYLGAVQIGLAYVFLTLGIRYVGALEAALLLLIEPVVNPLWAYLAHGEVPGRLAIVGGLIILAATVLRVVAAEKKVETTPPP